MSGRFSALAHAAQLTNILVGGFGLDRILGHTLAPLLAVVDRIIGRKLIDNLVADGFYKTCNRADAAVRQIRIWTGSAVFLLGADSLAVMAYRRITVSFRRV